MTPPRDSDDRYDGLPAPIRYLLPREEFLWLSEAEKSRVVEDYTEPDPEDRDDG